MIDLIFRFFVFCFGMWLLAFTFFSIVRTFVVPRNEKVLLTRIVFKVINFFFRQVLRLSKSFLFWDKVMALYAPLSLLALSLIGVALMFVSYWALFTGIGLPWRTAFVTSGSFLLTLGSTSVHSLFLNFLGFSEAILGLVMVALLVSFLPTIYSAFSKRETLVSLLEFRAGSPPSGVEIISRFYRLNELKHLDELWPVWEYWFVEVEESHTSLFALAFFRSPKPNRSWVNAAGAILDAASIVISSVEKPPNYQTDMCFEAGVSALNSISEFFDLHKIESESSHGNIHVTHEQYRLACLKLSTQGVTLKQDRDQAWNNFQKCRGKYAPALSALAKLTIAPEAYWGNLKVNA